MLRTAARVATTSRPADTTSGDFALWGQDLTPLYGQTLNFGDGGTYPVTLPAQGTITSAHDANTVILFCLSCHDGNLAKVGMMKGKTVETLPIVGGNAPTLLGNDGTAAGNYNNDHPVGARGDRFLRRSLTTGTAPAATPRRSS